MTQTGRYECIKSDICLGRLRLIYRWLRFGIRSIRNGYFDFSGNALKALGHMVLCVIRDLTGSKKVQCNICGWQGEAFYPNTGSGYYELNTVCPRCFCQDRHRTLVRILEAKTNFFSSEPFVIEVAPMRTFQKLCLDRKKGNYISFDYERYAMEKGDITKMRFDDNYCDYFLCFHVLEHITEEELAMNEIRRVLKNTGVLIMQVPVIWRLDSTIEYEKPDPRETGHVRRYGRDFGSRMESYGFVVKQVSIEEVATKPDILRFGYSSDPIYFLTRQV